LHLDGTVFKDQIQLVLRHLRKLLLRRVRCGVAGDVFFVIFPLKFGDFQGPTVYLPEGNINHQQLEGFLRNIKGQFSCLILNQMSEEE
jgi:hypothetical protein